MKCSKIHKTWSPVTVAIILLCQFTVSVVPSFLCPDTMSIDCSCQEEPEYMIHCSRDNEQITLKAQFGFKLNFKCSNDSNGKILELINFIQNDTNILRNIDLEIDSCPIDVISKIEKLIVVHINKTKLSIEVNNQITLPDNFLNSQNRLETLELSGSQLQSFDKNFFENQANLVELRLHKTQLPLIATDILNPLIGLKTLDLSENHLARLFKDNFVKLKKLTTLKLNKNALIKLPETVFNRLAALEELDLSENRLKILQMNILTKLTKLKKLDLNKNELVQLPDGLFEHCPRLTNLNINGNRIVTLPENIFRQQFVLEELNLGDNSLRILQENIFQHLTNLMALNLSGNKIQELPEKIFANQENLEFLDLNRNHLKTLPKDIFAGCWALVNLHISENNLIKLPENIFSGLAKLEKVYLNGNELKCISMKIVPLHLTDADHNVDVMCYAEVEVDEEAAAPEVVSKDSLKKHEVQEIKKIQPPPGHDEQYYSYSVASDSN